MSPCTRLGSCFSPETLQDGTVRLWSVERHEGFKPMALLEHRSPVRGVFFSEDLSYLELVSLDVKLCHRKNSNVFLHLSFQSFFWNLFFLFVYGFWFYGLEFLWYRHICTHKWSSFKWKNFLISMKCFLVFNFYHGAQLTKLNFVFCPFCVAFVALRFFSQGYIYSMQLVTKGTGESQFLMIFYWESKGG